MIDQPPSLSPPAAAAQAFGLGDTRIGMDLAALKARPGISCGPGQAPGVMLCHGPDRVLGGGYFARDPTYRFLGGRLAQVSFHSSIDAFSWVTAQLKKDDGQPSALARDTVSVPRGSLPHVLMTWKNGRSTIALSDPAQPPTQLSVKITRDAAAPKLPSDQS